MRPPAAAAPSVGLPTVRRDYGMQADQENTAPEQQAAAVQPKKQLAARLCSDPRRDSISSGASDAHERVQPFRLKGKPILRQQSPPRAATARENRGGKGVTTLPVLLCFPLPQSNNNREAQRSPKTEIP